MNTLIKMLMHGYVGVVVTGLVFSLVQQAQVRQLLLLPLHLRVLPQLVQVVQRQLVQVQVQQRQDKIYDTLWIFSK